MAKVVEKPNIPKDIVNRFFIYCRKSTDDEDHQVLSIESQRAELKRYVERGQLRVIEFLEEARSAKVPGRLVFNHMIERVRRGEADGIVSWHPDRLARNAVDSGQIIHLIDMGKLRELKFPTYTFENTPQGKFMLGIMFNQSKYYVDSLSENVRRGNRAKREMGWLPGNPPIGYYNARSANGEKIIASDPERFDAVKRLWELFLTAGYSVAHLVGIAKEMGLRTRKRRRVGGKPIVYSALYQLFCTPFYTGHIVYEGEWYPGRHEPMISVEQYDRAQQLLGRPGRPRPKRHSFPYTGLIRCGACGCSITAENKTQRHGYKYVYYHCTHKKAIALCQQRSIEQDELEAQICAFIDDLYLSDGDLARILTMIEGERHKEGDTVAEHKEALEKALKQSHMELENLARMRRRDFICDEEFLKQRAELLQEQQMIADNLKHCTADSWIEPSRKLFLFVNRAKFWLVHGGDDEKRLILSTLGSNPTLIDRILHIEAKEPFRVLRERGQKTDLWATLLDVRTFFERNPGYEIPILPEPALAVAA